MKCGTKKPKMAEGGYMNRGAVKDAMQRERDVANKIKALRPGGGTGNAIPRANARAARMGQELDRDNAMRERFGGDRKMAKGGVMSKKKSK